MKLIWDLEKLLHGKTHEEHLSEIEELVKKIESYKDFKLNAQYLLEIINYDNILGDKIDVLYQHYSLKTTVDSEDSLSDAKIKEIENIYTNIEIRLAFWIHWFIELSDDEANDIISDEKLLKFKYYLKELRKYKKHTKSEEVEKIITYASEASGSFRTLRDKITTKFSFILDKTEMNEAELRTYCNCGDDKLRKKGYKVLLNKYADNSTVLNEIYQAIVKQNNNMSVKVQEHASALQKKNLSNEISDNVVNSLFNTVQNKNNLKIFQDFFELKCKINGNKYDNSRYHIYAPINYNIDKKYSLDDALNIVYKVFRDFDPEYELIAKEIIKNKNVHSHPLKNKKGGAFCASVHGFNPYILMNFDKTLSSVFTLAHELGHAIHAVYSKDLPNNLRGASLNLCETASTFCENLLFEYLYNESNKRKEKIYLLADSLAGHYAIIQRQTYFCIFEKFVHENIDKGLRKENLENKYYSLLKEQFGSMEIPEIFKYEFYYIPHIFNSPFYCYSYSFGELLVLSLYEKFKLEGESFKNKYKIILSKGGSESPEDIIKGAGLNLSDANFWQLGYNVIESKVEKLKKLL